MNTDFKAGVVRVIDAGGKTVGTGFIVTSDGLIVTCAHVIDVARSDDSIHLIFYDPSSAKEKREVRVASVEPDYWRDAAAEDVAFLRLEGPLPKEAVPLPLGSSFNTQGPTFLSFGFPEAKPMLGECRVLGFVSEDNISLLQLSSNQVSKGFSGAPVWDDSRYVVIGMITSIVGTRRIKIAGAEVLLPFDPSGRQTETAFATPVETLLKICPLLKPSEVCPYRGLDAFTEDHAEFFFGREHIIDRLVNRLKQDVRFLAILGPSGSGKSSVVQAGLVPRLRQGAIAGSDQWELVVTRPADDPFKQLAAKGFEVESQDLTASVQAWLAQHPGRTRLVLVIDQFEELLTACPEAVRQEFVSQLTSLLAASLHITIILVMRDDFYDQFVRQETLVEWLEQSQGPVNVPQTLRQAELIAVVQKPAEAVGLRFEDGLIEIIVKDTMEAATLSSDEGVVTRSSNLPLLEFALTQLWERRENGMLLRNVYAIIGGVTGGLTQWADEVFFGLQNEEKQRKARRIFTALVHIGDEKQGLPDSRRRMSLDLLCRDDREIEEVHQIVQRLASARLLVTSYDIQSKQEIVEIIHDALLLKWGMLKHWLQEDRSFLVWHQELERLVHAWTSQHDKNKLLRGHDLTEAKKWLKERGTDLRQDEIAFLRSSATHHVRFVVNIIVVILLLMSTTGVAGVAGWSYLHQPPTPPDPAHITTLKDNEVGSLRWCINNAHSGSTITFAQSLSGTIELTGGDLVVGSSKRLTIVGPGANQLTISSGNSNAIIHVSKGAMLNISSLSFKNSETDNTGTAFLFNEGTLTMANSIISDNKTLTGGSSSWGGGIENFGTLTVTGSTFSNNSASSQKFVAGGGGIYNGGTAIVTNSVFSNNSASGPDSRGGAIFNEGTLTVTNSTFSNNSASFPSGNGNNAVGGAIYNENKLIVTNSTFSNNSASGSSSSSSGGGIYNLEQFTKDPGYDRMGTLMVTNSTFSNNSASGSGSSSFGGGGGIGIYNYSAGSGKGYSVIIRFCTIYGNTSSTSGGGIWIDPTRDGHLTISSSIVAANSAPDGPDISGALISDGYNLIENIAGATGFNARTDRQVTLADLKIDPTLGNNEGLTKTLALLQGSPAIDAVPRQACSITVIDASGHNVTITTDQRDMKRPDENENRCDIGAYESSP